MKLQKKLDSQVSRKRKPQPQAGGIWPLAGRVGLLLLLTLAAAAGFTVIGNANLSVIPAVMNIAAILGIGLAAGVFARRLLPHTPRALRLLAGFAAAGAALLAASGVSAGRIGISLFPANPGDGLWQAVPGCLAVWLALQAWHKKVARRQPRKAAARTPASAQPAAPVSAPTAPPAENHRSSPLHLLPNPPPARAVPVRLHGLPRTLKPRPAPRKRSAVQLLGAVEHRCPYCLEPVVTTDMSRVVICPVCNAHHHKDCWDITGTCQVPHTHG